MCLRLGIVKITFAIFVLTDIYTLGLGIIKASFASALDFCYICPMDIYTLGLGIIKASFASALDFCYICAAGRQPMMKCIKTDS